MSLLPSNIYEELRSFIQGKRTGEFTIHVKDGLVMKAVYGTHVKAKDEEP